jgi:hypothetical protein
MRNLVILELAAHLGDFKPTHIADCFASSVYRVVHCVFDAIRRGTDQLDLFVDVVTHEGIKCNRVMSSEHILRMFQLTNADRGEFSTFFSLKPNLASNGIDPFMSKAKHPFA